MNFFLDNKKPLLPLFFIILPLFIFSQNKSKIEIIGGLGLTGFLGDLGGSYSIGTHFIKDYNFNATRFCFNSGARYKNASEYFALKTMFAWGLVSGNDKYSKDIIRQNRNLNFRSPIAELSAQGEVYLINNKGKSVYQVTGLKSKQKKSKLSVYIFSGIGLFYYNPKEKLNNKWYSIKKYHTEGQGMIGGPQQFSNISIAIPFGIGFYKSINKKISMGIEFGIRKTFTDYIDGVSTRYYDKIKLTQTYGAIASSLADQSLGRIKGATMPGQERGDSKYKDSYIFLTINISYKMSKKPIRTSAKF